MENLFEYIYIRKHESYEKYGLVKVGKTQDLYSRDNSYATSEIKRGKFIIAYEFETKYIKFIDNLIKYQFSNLNVKYNSGTEFFKEEIINLLPLYFDSLGITYKILSENDIILENRRKRSAKIIIKFVKSIKHKLKKYKLKKYKLVKNKTKKILEEFDLDNIINKVKTLSLNSFTPRAYQTEIIDNSVEYYKTNSKGILVLTCGIGKTLISLWISQKLNCKHIIIGVYNTLLLEQWKNTILKLFDCPILIIDGNTNTKKVHEFTQKNYKSSIIICMYHSSYKLEYLNCDMLILDEVHHLTSNNISSGGKKFTDILKVNCVKQIALTATLKELTSDDLETIVSNTNEKYFGSVIERRNLLWSIENKIICDYTVQTIITDEDNLEEYNHIFGLQSEEEKRLLFAAIAAIKSIIQGFSHHLLLYTNKQENSKKIIDYVKKLLQYYRQTEIFCSEYHSDLDKPAQKEILKNFEMNKIGIISCVFCLGEGWDFPLLDGVVFVENMTSNIRIVQSALRASRKNTNEPNKISKIILPILNNDDWLNDHNSDFKKVKEVIYQMSLEDETISQKIKVSKLNVSSKSFSKKETGNNFFGEYDDDLTKALKLKTIKRTHLNFTYEKAKTKIRGYIIKNKSEYYKKCEEDVQLPENPKQYFRSSFVNWFDYLSLETKDYYDLETCKQKVKEYIENDSTLKKYTTELTHIEQYLSEIDSKFPPPELWTDYYNLNYLGEIITPNKKKKKKVKF